MKTFRNIVAEAKATGLEPSMTLLANKLIGGLKASPEANSKLGKDYKIGKLPHGKGLLIDVRNWGDFDDDDYNWGLSESSEKELRSIIKRFEKLYSHKISYSIENLNQVIITII